VELPSHLNIWFYFVTLVIRQQNTPPVNNALSLSYYSLWFYFDNVTNTITWEEHRCAFEEQNTPPVNNALSLSYYSLWLYFVTLVIRQQNKTGGIIWQTKLTFKSR
jgi:hypothetical protein